LAEEEGDKKKEEEDLMEEGSISHFLFDLEV